MNGYCVIQAEIDFNRKIIGLMDADNSNSLVCTLEKSKCNNNNFLFEDFLSQLNINLLYLELSCSDSFQFYFFQGHINSFA